MSFKTKTQHPRAPFECFPEVLSEKAIEQRLRRACSGSGKRKASAGQAAQKMYEDPANRDCMADMLIASSFSKVSRIRKNVATVVCKRGPHSCVCVCVCLCVCVRVP